YEKQNYEAALEFAREAVKEDSQCSETLRHFAGALCCNDQIHTAVIVYAHILELGLRKTINYHGENRDWALGFRSDCSYRLAQCYYDIKDYKLSKKWISLFLKYFHP